VGKISGRLPGAPVVPVVPAARAKVKLYEMLDIIGKDKLALGLDLFFKDMERDERTEPYVRGKQIATIKAHVYLILRVVFSEKDESQYAAEIARLPGHHRNVRNQDTGAGITPSIYYLTGWKFVFALLSAGVDPSLINDGINDLWGELGKQVINDVDPTIPDDRPPGSAVRPPSHIT
jgi:hypothetical protein